VFSLNLQQSLEHRALYWQVISRHYFLSLQNSVWFRCAILNHNKNSITVRFYNTVSNCSMVILAITVPFTNSTTINQNITSSQCIRRQSTAALARHYSSCHLKRWPSCVRQQIERTQHQPHRHSTQRTGHYARL